MNLKLKDSILILRKESFNSDGNQFHQYQQEEQLMFQRSTFATVIKCQIWWARQCRIVNTTFIYTINDLFMGYYYYFFFYL